MNVSEYMIAVESQPSYLLILIGVLVAAGLLGAFWWGSRARRRKSADRLAGQPRGDSWQTPDPPASREER
ncbi:DUF6479 family protein [Streptomyces sp. NPDC058646]|uniref:DUF6479 family protein n=1 Tax=Streptomyces sp. NPDC058646 TaxID=3346574 RepID=UPI0036582813